MVSDHKSKKKILVSDYRIKEKILVSGYKIEKKILVSGDFHVSKRLENDQIHNTLMTILQSKKHNHLTPNTYPLAELIS